jgi:hypothetical protein
MPSVIFTGQSGGMPLISGALGSGLHPVPITGVQILVARNASGSLYVGLSGGVTVLSGSYPLSGGGQRDGLELGPGDTYFVPKGCLTAASGSPPNIFVAGDAATSGQTRIYWEAT